MESFSPSRQGTSGFKVSRLRVMSEAILTDPTKVTVPEA